MVRHLNSVFFGYGSNILVYSLPQIYTISVFISPLKITPNSTCIHDCNVRKYCKAIIVYYYDKAMHAPTTSDLVVIFAEYS